MNNEFSPAICILILPHHPFFASSNCARQSKTSMCARRFQISWGTAEQTLLVVFCRTSECYLQPNMLSSLRNLCTSGHATKRTGINGLDVGLKLRNSPEGFTYRHILFCTDDGFLYTCYQKQKRGSLTALFRFSGVHFVSYLAFVLSLRNRTMLNKCRCYFALCLAVLPKIIGKYCVEYLN